MGSCVAVHAFSYVACSPAMTTTPRLYATLGISQSADLSTIRAAYKRLAFDNHPDRNPSDPRALERFVALSEAHDVLADSDRRRDYDAFGEAALAKGFEAATSRVGPLDLHVQIVLDPAVALRGGIVRLSVKRKRPCTGCAGRQPRCCGRCAGSGRTMSVQLARCRDCKGGRGLGFGGRQMASRSRAAPATDVPCATCEGRGVARVSREVRCTPCRGAGTLECAMCRGEKEAVSVSILALTFPAGVADGASLRFDGKGHTGLDGAVGELRVDVRLDQAAVAAPPVRGPERAVRSRPVRRAG